MNAFKTIALAYTLSFLACSVFFSDLFFLRNQSFMWHHDTEIPFVNTFALISALRQGTWPLFDPYDGMNFAFSHMAHGVYTVANIATAFIYLLFSPLYKFPGEAYHHSFSIVFHAVTMLIRTLGGYVLLRKFSLSPAVIVLALVFLNTFLSSTMYFGLVTENLYSYFPLLAYFIISFFERFRLKDLGAAALVLAVCVANSPLFALGYFYQNVHFLNCPF